MSSTKSSVSSATQPFSTSAGNSTGFMVYARTHESHSKPGEETTKLIAEMFLLKIQTFFKSEHKILYETKE